MNTSTSLQDQSRRSQGSSALTTSSRSHSGSTRNRPDSPGSGSRPERPNRSRTSTSTDPRAGRASSDSFVGGRGPARVSQLDRDQLASHPVAVRRVVRLFSGHTWEIVAVVVLITISSLVTMAQPFLVRSVIDDALPNANVRLLVWLTAAMVAVAAVSSLVGVVQTWLATRMGQAVMHDLRTSVFAHLQKQSLQFFTRTRGGEIQSRLTHDISGMQSVITSTATSVASQVTTVIATVVAMLALSPRLTALSLVILPPAVWLSRRVALLRRDITAAKQAELSNLHTQVEESLSVSGVRLAKTLGTAQWNTDRFEESSLHLIDLEVQSQLAGKWRMATMSIVFAAIPAAIYLVAGLPATSGGMTVGTLVAFTALQTTLFRPLMGLLDVGVQWVTAMALFSRIFEYLDLQPDIKEPVSPISLVKDDVEGDVRFNDVTFGYEAGDPVVRNVSIHIPSGTTTAIVGPTGSGKSTLAALLTRLYDPTSGAISIDGVDVRDMTSRNLAELVGVVSQETYLIHASIRENLLLGSREASEDQMWDALETAQIGQMISELPDGLDTVVGARGYRFSGGEQQRLSIARTLLRNPRILILDEATSALDNATEAQVQAALEALAVGRTTVTIAHRLSTVESADQVVVLKDGHIVERGSAHELRQQHGLFASLSGSASGPSS